MLLGLAHQFHVANSRVLLDHCLLGTTLTTLPKTTGLVNRCIAYLDSSLDKSLLLVASIHSIPGLYAGALYAVGESRAYHFEVHLLDEFFQIKVLFLVACSRSNRGRGRSRLGFGSWPSDNSGNTS